MHYSLALLFLCIVLGACTTSRALADLSEQEAAALAYINKDPFMRIVRSERTADGAVLVITRQGNKRILYRIEAAPDLKPSEMIHLVPPHPLYQKKQ